MMMETQAFVPTAPSTGNVPDGTAWYQLRFQYHVSSNIC